jgi:hypothetical protein
MLSYRQYLTEESLNNNLQRIYQELLIKMFSPGEILDPIPVAYGPTPKNATGVCKCQIDRFSRKVVPGSIKIFLKKRPYTDKRLKELLAHELIHAKLYLQNDTTTSHGPKFIEYVKYFSTRLDLDIPMTDDIEVEHFREDTKPKRLIVAIMTVGTDKFVGLSVEKNEQEYTRRILKLAQNNRAKHLFLAVVDTTLYLLYSTHRGGSTISVKGFDPKHEPMIGKIVRVLYDQDPKIDRIIHL